MEPLIDFGRETYLPWRIQCGEHLGRDLVHPYGPFSVYFNAGLFALFGPSIRTLVVANLFIFAGIVILLYRLLRQAFGFLPAATATFLVIPIFGFAHLANTGNYCFAFPYSHEATHGMALLLALLAWLVRPPRPPSVHGLVAGVIAALLSLTKTEYVFAGLAIFAAVGWRLAVDASARTQRKSWLAGCALGLVGVLLLTWSALALVTDAANATTTTFNALLAPFRYRSYSSSAHVLLYLGGDRPLENLTTLLWWGGAAAALLAVMAWIARRFAPIRNPVATVSCFAGLAIVTAVLLSFAPLDRCGLALPVLLAIGIVHTWRTYRRKYLAGSSLTPRLWGRSLLLIAAVAMMARMALAPRINHYGFFQAFLAFAWLSSFLIADYPALVTPRRTDRTLLSAVMVALLLALMSRLAWISYRTFQLKQTPIGEGADRIYGFDWNMYPRHTLWEHARKLIAAHTPTDANVLVLPEGVSLNYFARRRQPLRVLDALPATLPMNGTDPLEQLRRAPPALVVFVRRDGTDELGFANYGADAATGKSIVDWVSANYTPLFQAGEYPFSPTGFGLWILQRNQN